jgi:hypothetical protein
VFFGPACGLGPVNLQSAIAGCDLQIHESQFPLRLGELFNELQGRWGEKLPTVTEAAPPADAESDRIASPMETLCLNPEPLSAAPAARREERRDSPRPRTTHRSTASRTAGCGRRRVAALQPAEASFAQPGNPLPGRPLPEE